MKIKKHKCIKDFLCDWRNRAYSDIYWNLTETHRITNIDLNNIDRNVFFNFIKNCNFDIHEFFYWTRNIDRNVFFNFINNCYFEIDEFRNWINNINRKVLFNFYYNFILYFIWWYMFFFYLFKWRNFLSFFLQMSMLVMFFNFFFLFV